MYVWVYQLLEMLEKILSQLIQWITVVKDSECKLFPEVAPFLRV